MSVCPPLSVCCFTCNSTEKHLIEGDGVWRGVDDVRDQGGEPVAISDCMQMNACAENCIISGSRRGVGEGRGMPRVDWGGNRERNHCPQLVQYAI